jgi:hypothetical protein
MVLPMEHLIDEPLRANILQIRHLERRVAEKRNVHLSALLGVEAALYAVVHESHKACGYDNTVHDVSWRCRLPTCATYSEISDSECRICSSVMRI